MANPLDANELIKQGQTRTFYQPGGPGTPVYFFGLDTSYHFIDSAEMPTNGTIDPVFVPDPRRPNRYKLVARQIGAPDLPTVSLVFHEQWGGIPRALMAPKCEFNLYEVHSRCADLSDFYRGWDSYVLIYSGFRFEAGIDLGARTAADSDEGLTANLDAKGAAIYPVGSLGFGTEATSEVDSPIIDVVYGTSITCGDCGVQNDGSQFIYALADGTDQYASPVQYQLTVKYTINGGVSWSNSIITGVYGTPKFIEIAGNTLFVGARATNGTSSIIAYTQIDPITGTIGAWSSYTIANTYLEDVWVKSSRSIWFSGGSGSIYKTSDIVNPPSLVDNDLGASIALYRISGAGDTIVAVGGTASLGYIRYSKNGGATWTTITSTTVDASAGTTTTSRFSALEVLDDKNWIVGSVQGLIQKTTTGGATWTKNSFAYEDLGEITDIAFPTREVGWIGQNYNGNGQLWTTIDGGNTYVLHNSTSRIANYPISSIEQIRRIGVPYTAEPAVAANYITIGGKAVTSGVVGAIEGILISAAPTIV
jgi:hypothetical protein